MIQILVIEDDPAISHLIAGTLRKEGYACTCASDGKEGADDYFRWDRGVLSQRTGI